MSVKIGLMHEGGFEFTGSGESEWIPLHEKAMRATAGATGAYAKALVMGSMFGKDDVGTQVAYMDPSDPITPLDIMPLFVKVIIDGEATVRLWVPKG